MTDLVFVDTNVFVYALGPTSDGKAEPCRGWLTHLWSNRSGRLSFQVLQEFYATSVRNNPTQLGEARASIRELLDWSPVRIDAAILQQAWFIQDRYRLSWWDSLIVAAAQASSCALLLTEDLQHGQMFDSLRVVSPFLAQPGAELRH